MSKIEFRDFGVSPYREIWQLQKDLREEVISSRTMTNGEKGEFILSGEHLPVYTIGFHGDASNLLLGESELNKRGCECIRIERGGDITFHGPGQIMLYPIIDLSKRNIGVKRYVEILERSVIHLLGEYAIVGERVEGATGVWIGRNTPLERKICAIGVKVSHGVTIHGLALNVNVDLRHFSVINPCGFVDKGVTSMEAELGKKLDIDQVKTELVEQFIHLLSEE